MSLKLLEDNVRKSWLNGRMENLSIDGSLTVDGDPVSGTSYEIVQVTIKDSAAAVVGQGLAHFSSQGHIIPSFYFTTMSIDGISLTGVTAGATSLTVEFNTVPARLPSTNEGLVAVIGALTPGYGVFSTDIVISVPATLTAGAHFLNGMSCNFFGP